MKKSFFILAMLYIALTLIACSNSGCDISYDEFSAMEAMSASDFNKMYSNIDAYKGQKVIFSAVVFTEPEWDDSSTYLQVWADPKNFEKNTIIFFDDPDFEVKMNDFVIVEGIVHDTFEGENVFGATITAPIIKAFNLSVTDYVTAVAPTFNTIEFEETIDQNGYSITVEKIELAESETRVYLSISNNTGASISFYSFDSKTVQNGKQYDEDSNYEAGYPEIASNIVNGATSSGIITFPPIENAPFQLLLEGYCDDWDIDIETFTFNIQ